ncbi:hypothetical protein ABT294_22420 [Nonomuraea sp. NPDC000554]|uniref:IS1096 element passenger TnpR family protein n=1 Tax=Nonomuraea sp. NPDC000554 TaxID=3154259 RepID=UPI00332C2EC4
MWDHDLIVEKVHQATPNARYPRCSAGGRACPPEDSGGPEGFTRAAAQEVLEGRATCWGQRARGRRHRRRLLRGGDLADRSGPHSICSLSAPPLRARNLGRSLRVLAVSAVWPASCRCASATRRPGRPRCRPGRSAAVSGRALN